MVEGAPKPIFFCKHKGGFERRNWYIEPDESCINFERPWTGPEPGEIEEVLRSGAKVIWLSQGKYATVDAAKAYDKKAKEAFGEFAYLNFPDR